MDTDAIRRHIDLAIKGQITRSNLVEADSNKNELVLTYNLATNNAATKPVQKTMSVVFPERDDAFKAYVMVKTDRRYGLNRREEPKDWPAPVRFDVA